MPQEIPDALAQGWLHGGALQPGFRCGLWPDPHQPELNLKHGHSCHSDRAAFKHTRLAAWLSIQLPSASEINAGVRAMMPTCVGYVAAQERLLEQAVSST